MKKPFVKVGLMVMAFTAMITMNACSKINNETAAIVCDALSDKYGESFEAVRIGDRFNTDSAKLYVRPTNNIDLVFTATINKNTGVVEDDYTEEKVNQKVENVVIKAFLDNEIIVSSKCMVVTQNPLETKVEDYTPASFRDEYLFDHYTVYLIIENGDFSASDIIDSVKKINSAIGVKLVIAAYVFESDSYAICSEKLQNNPDISITMIEAASPVYSFDINIDSGDCSISETDLDVQMRRS